MLLTNIANSKYIYFVAENLVLWARSETIGYAANICHGMMKYWNVGLPWCDVRIN
jgi:hypothetical protein